jgi:hypothetical protein
MTHRGSGLVTHAISRVHNLPIGHLSPWLVLLSSAAILGIVFGLGSLVTRRARLRQTSN